MMITDSHCHLAARRFGSGEIGEVLARAAAAGVGRMVTLSTNLEDLEENLAIAARHPAVHVGAGIHPCDVHEAEENDLARLGEWLGDSRVAAVGETGLDYFHPAPDGWDEARYRARQAEMLERQFDLAAAAGLNIVLHTRDRSGDASFRDALAIYARHAGRVRAVFHCFPGTWESAKQVLDLGGLVSFTGIVTFSKPGESLETATRCPKGSFMVETDSPYLAPAPHRGKRNEPAFVVHVAERLAAARGETAEEFARHTNETADGFFRFTPRS
jgi:TatD DNase family protein